MSDSELLEQKLCDLARKARKQAYAPYSRCRVGAALLCPDGRIICGANVENASYGLSICAERSAVSAAVSAGYRHFLAVAVSGEQEGKEAFFPPCGACRQVLWEFCDPDCPVYLVKGEERRKLLLKDLLPSSFGSCCMKGEDHEHV
jgi:cytidine deaminase